jgi:hypothetical protein
MVVDQKVARKIDLVSEILGVTTLIHGLVGLQSSVDGGGCF